MFNVESGIYSTNPGACPSQGLLDKNYYGTLFIHRDTAYPFIIYLSVVGEMLFWAQHANTWAVVRQ